jgi:nucleoside-diphosphate-sugar epimerase
MNNIFVTGASGFVGHALMDKMLTSCDYKIFAAVRKLDPDFPSAVKQWKFDGISTTTDWNNSLQGIDCIIYTAARVHIMSDTANDPLEEFRAVNTIGTLNLARQAADLGVKRFIYLSSIKVNGESTQLGMPFTEDDKFVPTDPYPLSKYEAELGLLELAKKTQMEVVIIRPPLVYGPGVKANFLSMMKWLNKGIPLPFGAINNKRSLVALDNLVDLILTCIDHPAAANQVFLVSDGDDLSTTELLQRVATSLGKKPILMHVNQQLLEIGLKLVGKKDLAQRLYASLQVDISKAKKLLNWTPAVSVDEGFRKTTEAFKGSRKS